MRYDGFAFLSISLLSSLPLVLGEGCGGSVIVEGATCESACSNLAGCASSLPLGTEQQCVGMCEQQQAACTEQGQSSAFQSLIGCIATFPCTGGGTESVGAACAGPLSALHCGLSVVPLPPSSSGFSSGSSSGFDAGFDASDSAFDVPPITFEGGQEASAFDAISEEASSFDAISIEAAADATAEAGGHVDAQKPVDAAKDSGGHG